VSFPAGFNPQDAVADAVSALMGNKVDERLCDRLSSYLSGKYDVGVEVRCTGGYVLDFYFYPTPDPPTIVTWSTPGGVLP